MESLSENASGCRSNRECIYLLIKLCIKDELSRSENLLCSKAKIKENKSVVFNLTTMFFSFLCSSSLVERVLLWIFAQRKKKHKTPTRCHVCVCVILPVQKAPQNQGHPGTLGPQSARTVAGRLLPAGGGGSGVLSPGKVLGETQEETQQNNTENTCWHTEEIVSCALKQLLHQFSQGVWRKILWK